MGQRPTATIYVGVLYDQIWEQLDNGTLSDEDKAPQHRMGNPDFAYDVSTFWAGDEVDGYGIQILQTDWNDNNDVVSLANLDAEAQWAKTAMISFLREKGIDLPVHTRISCDIS